LLPFYFFEKTIFKSPVHLLYTLTCICAERVALLEKQVSDLLLLTRHQASTLQALQEESFQKSQRILQLQNTTGKAAISADSSHVLRPKMRLASEIAAGAKSGLAAAAHHQRLHPVDAMQTAEKRIQQLCEERDFWRRHFSLAEQRADRLDQENKMLRAKESLIKLPHSAPPLKQVDLNATDAESLFVRNLLKENIELKQEVARLSGNSGKKTVTIQEAAVVRPASAAANGSAQSKENRFQGVLPPVATRNNSIVAPGRNGGLPVQSNSARPLSAGRPPWATNNANRFPRPPGGVAPVRGRTPPGLPAASFRPPPAAGAGGPPPRHAHTTECRGMACCATKECECAACSVRVRAQGLQAQLHQLSQQNSCLVGQVCRFGFSLNIVYRTYIV
jgi:hypothetical protein